MSSGQMSVGGVLGVQCSRIRHRCLLWNKVKVNVRIIVVLQDGFCELLAQDMALDSFGLWWRLWLLDRARSSRLDMRLFAILGHFHQTTDDALKPISEPR